MSRHPVPGQQDGDYRTLLDEVRDWAIELLRVDDPQIALLDRRLRQRLGTQRVYVPRQSKRERLEKLAALPADAPPAERTKAAGIGAARTRQLWRLLGR